MATTRPHQRMGSIALSLLITFFVVFGFVAVLGLLPSGGSTDSDVTGLPERTEETDPVGVESGLPAARGGIGRVPSGVRSPRGPGGDPTAATGPGAAPGEPGGVGAGVAAPGAGGAPSAGPPAAGQPHEHQEAAGAPWQPGAPGPLAGGVDRLPAAAGSPVSLPPFSQLTRPFYGEVWDNIQPALLGACRTPALCFEVVVQVRPQPAEPDDPPEGESVDGEDRCRVTSFPSGLNKHGQYVVTVRPPCDSTDSKNYVPKGTVDNPLEGRPKLPVPAPQPDDKVDDPPPGVTAEQQSLNNRAALPGQPGELAVTVGEPAGPGAADAVPANGAQPANPAGVPGAVSGPAPGGGPPGGQPEPGPVAVEPPGPVDPPPDPVDPPGPVDPPPDPVEPPPEVAPAVPDRPEPGRVVEDDPAPEPVEREETPSRSGDDSSGSASEEDESGEDESGEDESGDAGRSGDSAGESDGDSESGEG